MKQQALQTAMTLYRGGTLDLETAASKAGVDPERFERDAERFGDVISRAATDRDHKRVPLHASD